MELNITVDHIKHILIESAIVDTIVPSSVLRSKKNDVIDGYSSIILSLLNIRLNNESRDYKVLNTIINKAQDSTILEELDIFIVRVSTIVKEKLVKLDIDVDLDQLILDLNTILNNISRESVLGIYVTMDVSVFNIFRKHIFALSKPSLSRDELFVYKKYMKAYIEWVVTEPKKFRLAINNIVCSVNRNELRSRESISNVSNVRSILLGILELDYNRDVLNTAVLLLIYRNYWMVIPEGIMVLKLRRRLGRLTDRLLSSVNTDTEFKLKKELKC